MTEKVVETDLEKEFPSIELAYDVAIASFDTSQKRMDAVDGKTQSLMVMCVTSFLAFPTIAKALNVPFVSIFFVIAMLCIFASIVLSVFSLKTGKVDRLDPSALFNEWLDLPRGKFMKDAIFHAGESLRDANSVVENKWNLSNLSLIFYFAAILSASLWLATA